MRNTIVLCHLHHECNNFMVPLSCQVKSPSHTSRAERHAVPCSFCSLGAMPFAVIVTACRMARPGHTTQPRLFRHAAKVLVPSGALRRIALNSRNMSRRSLNSNTRSCSQSLVLVVVARLGPESVQNAAASKWAARRLAGGRARQGQWCTPQPCPSQRMLRPCQCSPWPIVYTPASPLAPSEDTPAMAPSCPGQINLHPQHQGLWGCRPR